MSCKIDPILITDSLNTAREKINDVYSGITELWSGSTGFQSIVSRGNDTNFSSSDYSVVLGGQNNSITSSGDRNVIIGGQNNLIEDNSFNSAIIGGENNILSGTNNSVIVGSSNITGVTDFTTFVPNLETSGNRVRRARYVTLDKYEPDKGKIEAVQPSDEILLITDATTNTDGAPALSDLSLDLRLMISDDQIGRTVELVMIDNSGFIGEILIGVSGGDFSINGGILGVSLSCCSNNFQHVTITYLGYYNAFLSTTPVPMFAVTGTGL